MKLPESERASIDERKVREYLLSTSHPVGRFKAKFFAGLGFGLDNWQAFAVALARLASSGSAQLIQDNDFGRKYLVLGALTGPQGRTADVVSVWIIRTGSTAPHLVTVYPG